ncbi:MAG: type II secretion system minor pseudopilin GspJ [Granulosicoccaceae bacterium]|jgi:general secretion pathway protein J
MKQSGMTLLELLIAVAVFAVLATLAYGGLDAVLNTSRAAQEEMARLAEVQRALARISADIEQMAVRPVRDNYGDTLAPLRIEQDDSLGARIEFTRHGNHNLTGQARSTLQRIAYTLRDGRLVRQSWGVLDRAQDTIPYEAELLEGVTRFEVDVLQAQQAEAAGQPGEVAGTQVLPGAVEIRFELQQWGEFRRLIRVAA